MIQLATRKFASLIREAGCDVIINMSTGGGAGQTTDEQRAEPVDLAPEIASFDCGSTEFRRRGLRQLTDFLDSLAARMKAHGVLPEIECFEPGHVANALRFIDEGAINPPFWFQFVLGVRGGSPGTIETAHEHGRHASSRTPIGRSAASGEPSFH